MARIGKIPKTVKPFFTVDDPDLVVYGPGGVVEDTEEALVRDQADREARGLPLPLGGRVPVDVVQRVEERVSERLRDRE